MEDAQTEPSDTVRVIVDSLLQAQQCALQLGRTAFGVYYGHKSVQKYVGGDVFHRIVVLHREGHCMQRTGEEGGVGLFYRSLEAPKDVDFVECGVYGHNLTG